VIGPNQQRNTQKEKERIFALRPQAPKHVHIKGGWSRFSDASK
jgi:hypothetical protein